MVFKGFLILTTLAIYSMVKNMVTIHSKVTKCNVFGHQTVCMLPSITKMTLIDN